ncbi:RDD family protein [Variovorax sp. LT1P1]|uniref:RDD family protein n=1 Tax=Variovorax sp. LT1P1 TaxID=3443730 RepID=UPI003F44D64D
MRRAGFWVRLLAFQIDLLFVGMLCLALLEVLTRAALASGRSGFSWPTGCALAIVTGSAYFIGFESSRWQGTLGKRFLGLVVARRVGGQLSLIEASLRTGAAALGGSLLGLGFCALLRDPLRRAAHDRLSDTLVARWATAGVLPDSLSRFEGRFITALSIVLAAASAVVVDAALSGPLGTAYQRHQRTARVERALQYVSPVTHHIASAIQTDRKYPDALDPALIASVGSAAGAAVAYNPRSGVVTLQLGRTPEGSIATLSLYPVASGSEIAWRCSAFAIPARHLPSTCKS